MRTEDIFALGLGLAQPWKLLNQRLDTEKIPHELHLEIGADRGTGYPCPRCGKTCKAHDFQDFTWRHLNFFQHHCYITASVPRVRCPEHKVKQVTVPWARKGSSFTLLFEQAAMSRLDLSSLKAFGLDETKSRKGHRYVTVFIDLDRVDKRLFSRLSVKANRPWNHSKNT